LKLVQNFVNNKTNRTFKSSGNHY